MTNQPDLQAIRALATMVQLPELPGVGCLCGTARRAFADLPDFPATVHLTQITLDAETHYHLRQTEVYVIVTCLPDGRIWRL